jgi:protein-S-isoprenylcysteine O-methyltransferase Ste14
MVKVGNFFFHYRNILFPFFYVMLFVPSPVLTDNYSLVFYIGLAITTLGEAIRFTTIGLVYIVRGGKDRKIYAEGLVTDGIYSHSRNPMYVGNVLMLVGMGILSNSLLFVCTMIPFFIFIYQAIILAEENFLRGKFGTSFDEYCANTNRWTLKLAGLGETFKSFKFNTKRALYKEYNTTYLWCVGILSMIAVNIYRIHGKEALMQYKLYFIIIFSIVTVAYILTKVAKKRHW